MSSSTSSSASATSSASPTLSAGSNLKVVGIILAVASGLLIGSSFVFKKKGLLRSQAGQAAGEGVAYLKSPLWWLGMTMMIMGEICNFAAYAFVEALIVTPMGALSVVICAILSSIFLKETLTFFGWLGCALCIIGSVIIALNGPQEASVGQITEFQKLFLAPGFLAYGSVLIAVALVIVFFVAPKYGTKTMLWYILVCSMIGGISVSVTTGLGAAVVTTAFGDNQFKHWFIYFLIIFVAATLITEVFYLNKALAIFNTAMVTPTYYVIFTFFSMVTTIVLFQGLKASAAQILTIVMGFLTICVGITILQMSKVDPTEFKKLDRKSTILLQAARAHTEAVDEKDVAGVEDPGIDALRGSFGAVGSIIRAKTARRMSMNTTGSIRSRTSRHRDVDMGRDASMHDPHAEFRGALKRHQLYDAPMPSPDILETGSYRGSVASRPSLAMSGRHPTIKFDSQDVVHQYHPTVTGDNTATHEHRTAPHSATLPPSPKPRDYADTAKQNSLPALPPLDYDDGALRSAPPVLTGLDTSDPYHRPRAEDPFAGSPSTSTLSSFPSISSITQATAGSTIRPSYDDDDGR
ncbi:DUF803-domain-containing protein [Heliocybe sulcata]|uniref:DUF803-domain-containing protein n=1 Tax=Heliocybe sulcata TaxID=5364 RepID=A0A5C3NC26_9AGAM|nr:DUF803-domain-containing protein [Heliocybe sulcata]